MNPKVVFNLKLDYFKFVNWLSTNYTKDNKNKLQFLATNVQGDISIDQKQIAVKRVVRLRDIKIDINLRLDDHVSSLCKKGKSKTSRPSQNIHIHV